MFVGVDFAGYRLGLVGVWLVPVFALSLVLTTCVVWVWLLVVSVGFDFGRHWCFWLVGWDCGGSLFLLVCLGFRRL